jgi:4-amino-4-deoxy-L-arabinose transferase-like glycosyltransferase
MSASATEALGVEPPEPTPVGRRQLLDARRLSLSALRHAGLPLVVAFAAVLNTHRLQQNGYANVFYSAGVQSMLRSLHNFLFVSFDPGGLVSVDKPPIAVWVQVLSAKLFGFSPLSLLLPEALAGVLSVALLYVILAKRLGVLAALAGALALATFPSFVAVSRDNGVDPVLLLLMICACGICVRAAENGRTRTLVCCAIVVGLAFNTKTLAAYLVVPGIALAFLVCAPGSIRRRLAQLLLAGVVMLVVSFAWIFYVDATPASKRPYVGSSTNNSEIGLTFGYNGLGRVEGQEGGPHGVPTRQGGFVPIHQVRTADDRARAHGFHVIPPAPGEHVPKPDPAPKAISVKGREKLPIPFGSSPNALRLFGKGLGDQAGWMLPFALFGLIALALLALPASSSAGAGDRGGASADGGEDWRSAGRRWTISASSPEGDRSRLACALAFGGWFVVEAAVLSLSKGIVHPYYVSGLAPATAAVAGAGALAFVKLAQGRRRPAGIALVACALAATVAAQVILMRREHYMLWFIPALIAGAALAFAALLAMRRLAAPAVAFAFALLLVTPAAYATTTWLAPVEGTFPVAGPKSFPGPGGYGVDARDLAINRALVDFASTHRPGSRWALLTVASDTAAPMMLLGLEAGALGGYSGTDNALDGPGLARYVRRGEARYVLLGGGYSQRGGNAATKAVLRACRELAPWEWRSPDTYPYGLVLFDCAGRARALASQ